MELWAIARKDLGLSGFEFGRLTFRAITALIDRVNMERRLADRRAGEICAIIATAAPHLKRKGGGNFTAADFFPSLIEEAPQKQQSPEEILAIFQALADSGYAPDPNKKA